MGEAGGDIRYRKGAQGRKALGVRFVRTRRECDTMILFHGSNIEVSAPRLMPQARALDFGQAFYLTSDIEQASKWAQISVLRRGEGTALVSVYEFDDENFQKLNILNFDAPNAEWLRYVTANRMGRAPEINYDIVVGPVANDNTMPVLNLFFKGAYSEDETLRRLLPQRLKDQYAFKTDVALSYLEYREVRKV